jgi:phage tail sheath gpL-like
MRDLFNDVTGRWAWNNQLYGHGFAYRPGSVGALSTFGRTRNDQHMTIAGIDQCPTPVCEVASAWAAQVAGSIVVDPARPVQTLPLPGVVPPPPEDRFTILERQVLYFDGIACSYVDTGGVVRIDRSITTYQRNVWGAPDNSYLDLETLYTLAYFNRFMRNRILTKFPRHKLADDGTRFGAGQAIVTPTIIRSEMIAAYGEMEEAGLMENMDAFKNNLIVERNAQDPNRVDALLPPDLVNQLRIFAALVQFRLRTVSVEA